MAPNQRARKTHDALFPGHVSILAVADPGLIEVFDFIQAANEVLAGRGVGPPTRELLALAIQGSWPGDRRNSALAVTPRAIWGGGREAWPGAIRRFGRRIPRR